MVQFGANFALEASVVHARQACLGNHLVHDLEREPACVAQGLDGHALATIEAAEQDGWDEVGDALDADGEAPAEEALVGDALGQQTDSADSLLPEAAALMPAALGTWPELGLV